jgi:hypothetical protein
MFTDGPSFKHVGSKNRGLSYAYIPHICCSSLSSKSKLDGGYNRQSHHSDDSETKSP